MLKSEMGVCCCEERSSQQVEVTCATAQVAGRSQVRGLTRRRLTRGVACVRTFPYVWWLDLRCVSRLSRGADVPVAETTATGLGFYYRDIDEESDRTECRSITTFMEVHREQVSCGHECCIMYVKVLETCGCMCMSA